jgi:hypothetical protein
MIRVCVSLCGGLSTLGRVVRVSCRVVSSSAEWRRGGGGLVVVGSVLCRAR